MKKIKIWHDIAAPVVSLTVICVVCTALLAISHEITSEPIAQAELEERNASMMSVLPGNTEKCEEIRLDDTSARCYAALDENGEVLAYAIETSAKGYGGTIKVMTGVSVNGRVLAVNVYDNSEETPGLGAKTSDKTFTAQFPTTERPEGFAVSRDIDKYEGYESIDAVTGATISSRAVAAAVTHAVKIADSVGE